MSLTANRFSRAFSSSEYSATLSLDEALFEEGYVYNGKFLEEIQLSRNPATQEDLDYLRDLFWDKGVRGQDLKKEISSLFLTRGGEKILHEAVRDYKNHPLSEYVDKFHFTRNVALWQSHDANNNFEITQPLLDCKYWTEKTEFKNEIDILWNYGIRWVKDAIKLYQLIPHVWVRGRSLTSPYQVDLRQVVLVATNPNYRNLPMWAKIQTIKGNHASDRPGDVWRTLMPALKAWKWEDSFPKATARRLGEMSPKFRALGAVAWRKCDKEKNNFWEEFRLLCKNPDKAVYSLIFGKPTNYGGTYYFTSPYIRNRSLELLWGLPHEYLNNKISENSNNIRESVAFDIIATYGGGSAAICRGLFGCTGKRIEQLFATSTEDARKWAVGLAYGNQDLVQKYLASECVPFQEETIGFLKFLGEKPALRMLQTTTMNLRGKSQPVTADYVRDTGYLFNQLQNAGVTPNLGRVRCWFSTHELLAKEYIKILPDFELKINSDFAPLDGVCSLDMAWELELPKHQHQLKHYGEILIHCVGGYGSAINQGRSVIVAVYYQGVLKYTLEFVSDGTCRKVGKEFYGNYKCNQFYGYRNSYPTSYDRNTVLDIFRQANLISS